MSHREPKFMRELHKVRERLAKADEKLPAKERIAQARKDSKWIKTAVAKLKERRKVS